MSDLWLSELADAIRDTIVMVGVSAFIAALIGIPLALVLVTTTRGGIFEKQAVNSTLGALVNAFRSTPFIILLVALLPLTRLLIGTTIGVWAAIVPLSIAAIPFFARVAEVSLREVDRGLIEAAQAMGAQRRHIIWHVLLARSAAGHSRRLHDHRGGDDRLVGHGGRGRRRRPRRSGDPLRLSAFRYDGDGDGDRAADRDRHGGAVRRRPVRAASCAAGVMPCERVFVLQAWRLFA